MKWLIAIAVALSIVTVGRAQQSDAYGNRFQYTATAFTNAAITTIVTYETAVSSYHTIQLVSPAIFYYSIGRTADGTNWFYGATNTIAANLVAETAITGKYKAITVRAYGTNASFKVNYFGGGQ
jgi:hypothetical protein